MGIDTPLACCPTNRNFCSLFQETFAQVTNPAMIQSAGPGDVAQ